jgi:hypothetical protein
MIYTGQLVFLGSEIWMLRWAGRVAKWILRNDVLFELLRIKLLLYQDVTVVLFTVKI